MHPLLQKLVGGDRRSIGAVGEVVEAVLADADLFKHLFTGMMEADDIVRMRAADAVEKVTATRPEHLSPYKTEIIEQIARSEQQEARWHLCQMFPVFNSQPRSAEPLSPSSCAMCKMTAKS